MADMEEVQLPPGKVLMPGLITHSTNIVEHPELVAERFNGSQVRWPGQRHRRHRLRLLAEPARRPRSLQHHVGEAADAGRGRGDRVEDGLGVSDHPPSGFL